MGKRRERSEYNRAWREANAEKVRERQREYRRKNRERIRQYHAEWVRQNRDRVRGYALSEGAAERERERERCRYREDAAYRERRKQQSQERRERLRTEPELRERERASVRKYQSSAKGTLARRRRELRPFGISPEEYDRLSADQGGVCAICGKQERWRTGRGKTAHLAVDHCHATGRVRGLLCRQCNRGLGLLGDTADSIRRALRYLE